MAPLALPVPVASSRVSLLRPHAAVRVAGKGAANGPSSATGSGASAWGGGAADSESQWDYRAAAVLGEVLLPPAAGLPVALPSPTASGTGRSQAASPASAGPVAHTTGTVSDTRLARTVVQAVRFVPWRNSGHGSGSASGTSSAAGSLAGSPSPLVLLLQRPLPASASGGPRAAGPGLSPVPGPQAQAGGGSGDHLAPTTSIQDVLSRFNDAILVSGNAGLSASHREMVSAEIVSAVSSFLSSGQPQAPFPVRAFFHHDAGADVHDQVPFATVVPLFAGSAVQVDVVFRPEGSRSPNTCENRAFISLVLKGLVECKELFIQSTNSEVVARCYRCADPSVGPELLESAMISVATKFALNPKRAPMFLPAARIYTMKATCDTVELRVTDATTPGPASPGPTLYFWAHVDPEHPGVPRVVGGAQAWYISCPLAQEAACGPLHFCFACFHLGTFIAFLSEILLCGVVFVTTRVGEARPGRYPIPD